MSSIAVIGGGFSGAAFAIHMSRLAPQPVEILLIEPRERLGAGLAHSAAHPDHRLNAADSIHLLHLDQPDHFSVWLKASGALERDPDAIAANGRVYPRRSDFGAYVNAEIARHQESNPSGTGIRHVRRRALRITRVAEDFDVTLEDGMTLRVGACVLALGQGRPNLPALLRDASGHPDCVANPWDLDALGRIDPGRSILILGTGLTTADVVATLVSQGHRAPIDAVSRRGMRPTRHSAYAPTMPRLHGLMQEIPDFVARHGTAETVAGIVKALRADIGRIDPARASWHALFDEVRDASHVLWPHLSTAEQMRFLRHLKPWYDVHRFRIPPQNEQIVARAVDAGQLAFHSARTLSILPGPRGFEVAFQNRGAAGARMANYATLINCTGFDNRLAALTDPLVQGLAGDGLLRASPCGIGVEIDAQARAIGVRGASVPKLHVIGPLTAGSIGEASSVPVITRQILQMIPRLLEDLSAAR